MSIEVRPAVDFEDAGLRQVTDTTSVLNGHPRVLVRHDLDSRG